MRAHRFDMFDSAWGALPIAAPLLVFVAHRLAWLVFGREKDSLTLAGTAVAAMALVHASVGALGEFGVLSGGTLLLVLCVAAVALFALSANREVPLLLPSRETWPAVALAGVTIALAAATARLLPVWQWDSFGYHLPYVNFVLQSHGFREVPADLRYISTYPHNIELGMIWLRAMLPDDRLVDLAQVPYGVAGATITAAIALELGASRGLAALAGAGWLTLPGVFLQLPTNYVDVGTAAALLGAVFFLALVPVTSRSLLAGGLALGLFLGSKPSAPLATAVLGALALVRAARSGRLRSTPAMLLLSLLFGAEMYAVMALRHGNPIWPVSLRLGPVTLPGDFTVDELLAAGAATPRSTGPLAERLSASWLALDSLPVFDMRLGGFGALSLLALPLGIAALVRRRDPWLLLVLCTTLLSPDPSVARYVLAFPALMLALALAELARLPRLARPAALAVVMGVGCWQLVHAWPGLCGDGPEWTAFVALTDEQRRVALGPHGRPSDYPPTWALVGPGESIAFDTDFEFPGLLWDPRLSFPVHALPESPPEGWLDARRVRVLAVGPRHRALADPSRWRKLFDCRSASCAVYARVDSLAAAASSAAATDELQLGRALHE